MIYGILTSACLVAPIMYLLVCNIRNDKRIAYMNSELTQIKNKQEALNCKIEFVKGNDKAELCYKILKDQCKRMGTCGMFK